MSHDSRGNEPDQVNSGALAVVLGIVALATLAVALVVTALVRDEVASMTAQRDVTQDREYRDLRAAQLSKLQAPAAWLDKATGVVSLPIDRAGALVLEEVRSNPAKLSPWLTSAAPAPAEGDTPVDTSATDGASPAAPATAPADAAGPAPKPGAAEPASAPAPAGTPAPAAGTKPAKPPAQATSPAPATSPTPAPQP